ncbi:MAG TPA: YbaY family lipoprotein, partial [Pirellulaceae bacterium]|nr:YbaY family lipoprotein [Pirellulaceae bacterium]
NSSQSKAWRLGDVNLQNTNPGVRVLDIDPNSTASRSGLRKGDMIITVGGSQVGFVEGRLYDLAEEANRRATSQGRVAMLVQDGNNGRLGNVNVQLESSQALLTGTIVGLDRLNMPPNATISIEIVNASRPHFAVRNGHVVLNPGGKATIPFTIAYDPAYVYAQDVYHVKSQVSVGSEPIYYSQDNYRVITQGNPSTVQLQFVSMTNVARVRYANSNQSLPVADRDFDTISRLISTHYQRYLRREPNYLEVAALWSEPDIKSRLDSLPVDLMATQEYYDASGNNVGSWVSRVFEEVVGRRPSVAELQQWQQRLADLRYSRTTMLSQLFAQARR